MTALGVASVVAAAALAPATAGAAEIRPHVLLFTKTAAFRHDSIGAAVAALRGRSELDVDATEDAGAFTDANLARYDVVVFLLTTGDVLDDAQQAALERFVRSGGGFAGVHSASDTEYDWPWYGRLVGTWFRGHSAVQQATVEVVDAADRSTRMLPTRWQHVDEWYSFRSSPADVHVLLTVDETTYDAGDHPMGAPHPVAWEHAFDGGHAWYTALGHPAEAWSDPLFVAHVVGGIRYAAGLDPPRIVSVRRVGRILMASAPGCRRCVAVVGPVRVRVRDGRVRLTLPRGTTHFSLRVQNLLNGRMTAVRR